jgi:alanine racemase
LDSLPDNIPLHLHIELDTGMHRLGFMNEDLEHLVFTLNKKKNLKIEGIYTHLASVENPLDDKRTENQITTFFDIADSISATLNYKPTYHISNSAASIRFQELNSQMVRLGISLYGINPVRNESIHLKPVFRLKTFISQIKTIPQNEGIGYGFEDVSQTNRQIAILPLGYADGFNRKFGLGKNYVFIHGKKAKTLGRICMDMCMVDVSDISCQEGDEVILFETTNQIQEWAELAETIPYEVLTSLSQRIKRVFVSEV